MTRNSYDEIIDFKVRQIFYEFVTDFCIKMSKNVV